MVQDVQYAIREIAHSNVASFCPHAIEVCDERCKPHVGKDCDFFKRKHYSKTVRSDQPLECFDNFAGKAAKTVMHEWLMSGKMRSPYDPNRSGGAAGFDHFNKSSPKLHRFVLPTSLERNLTDAAYLRREDRVHLKETTKAFTEAYGQFLVCTPRGVRYSRRLGGQASSVHDHQQLNPCHLMDGQDVEIFVYFVPRSLKSFSDIMNELMMITLSPLN
jgi:hypothetical protein